MKASHPLWLLMILIISCYARQHLNLHDIICRFASPDEAPGQVVRIASIRWAGRLNTVTGPAGVACSSSGAAVRWR